MAHPCDCCGFRTLAAPGTGTYAICPVCFWEHAPSDEYPWGGSNALTLREAQAHFLAHGVVEDAFIDEVRPPTAEEARDPDWLPWDQAKARAGTQVIAQITAAFAEVRLEGGTTLFDAEMIDDYGCDSPRNDAIRDLGYTRWEQIPGKILDSFRPTSFFDALGVRFHLPAYMARAVEDGDDSTVFWLTPSDGDLADWWIGKFSLIDGAQAAAIVAFLEFVERYDDWVHAGDGEKALAYWRGRVEGTYLPR